MTLNISRHSFVDSNTRSHQQWYPRDVLEICRDGRCVGYAHTKRRKCRMLIGSYSVSTMNEILDEMSRQLPDPTILRPQLRSLASYGLCGQFHRGQADSMVCKWSSMIYAAFPTGRVPISNPSPSYTVTSSISSTTPPQLENLRDTIQETMRCTNELLEIVSNNQPPVRTPSYSTSVTDISSPAPSRRSTTLSESSEHTAISSANRSTELIHQIVTPPSSISQISRPATPSSIVDDDDAATEPLTHQPQSCTRPHARRILLSDPCPICHEGGPLSSCPATDLVWCKSSCGRPVHKSCFEAWRTQRESDGQNPTCVICRADWDDECDCQGCHHVPRRSGEAACAICLDALVMGSGAGSEAQEEEGTVWCKDGCGQSVHRICFEVWQGHCADAGRDATCVLCRAAWNIGCLC